MGSLELIDFPIFMVTDDTRGMVEARAYTKDEYAAMMKPFYENMPRDQKMTHKPTITVLSDALVQVVDDFTMTMGKQKFAGKNAMLMVKVGGAWKLKEATEAGWGGMNEPPRGADARPPAGTATPTNTVAPKK
jgi:hypothetical protein